MESTFFDIDTNSNCGNEPLRLGSNQSQSEPNAASSKLFLPLGTEAGKARLIRNYDEGSIENRIDCCPGVLMSVSQAIASHIPYLRRFSRALTGNQSGGDAYVLATLEAIVADPAGFDATKDVRATLYKAFLQVWRSMPVNEHTDQVELSSDEHGARPGDDGPRQGDDPDRGQACGQA